MSELAEGIEIRVMHTGDDVELRVVKEDGKATKIVGLAAVFDKRSEDLGGFVEIIRPGAFTDALKTSDIRGLRDHDPGRLLGRTESGTLRVEETKRGLAYEIDLPDTELARDTAEAIDRGDLSGNSFSFIVKEERWTYPPEDSDEPVLREVLSVDPIFDVGPVTYPAYPDTTVALRSLDAHRPKAVMSEAAVAAKEERARKRESHKAAALAMREKK